MSNQQENQPYKLRRPGGEVDDSRVFNVPGVVLFVVMLTVLCFVIMFFSPMRTARIIEASAAVSPARFAQDIQRHAGWPSILSPLVTHMFVHAGIAHITMNMLFFLAMGSPIARRMNAEEALQSLSSLMAAIIFILFYLLSGVAGALVYIAAHANEPTLLIGASGGVFGLWGGVVRFAFSRTTLFGPENASISSITSPSVISWTLVVVGLNVAMGLFGGALTGLNIAWEAHIGGYFFGLLAYPFFERAAHIFR